MSLLARPRACFLDSSSFHSLIHSFCRALFSDQGHLTVNHPTLSVMFRTFPHDIAAVTPLGQATIVSYLNTVLFGSPDSGFHPSCCLHTLVPVNSLKHRAGLLRKDSDPSSHPQAPVLGRELSRRSTFWSLIRKTRSVSPSHSEGCGTSFSWGGQVSWGLLGSPSARGFEEGMLHSWAAPAVGCLLSRGNTHLSCTRNLRVANLSPRLLED